MNNVKDLKAKKKLKEHMKEFAELKKGVLLKNSGDPLAITETNLSHEEIKNQAKILLDKFFC